MPGTLRQQLARLAIHFHPHALDPETMACLFMLDTRLVDLDIVEFVVGMMGV